MRKYRVKKWVKGSIFALSLGTLSASLFSIGNNLKGQDLVADDFSYVSKEIVESEVREVSLMTNEKVERPYLYEGVKISKSYFDKNGTEEDRINSLLYYKNTYMQNSGILYTADSEFDVVSVLDGAVTSITEDEILGNVVEIAHSTELITIYHCMGTVNVKVGDSVKQNDVIGTSGRVNVDAGYEHALLFEVNYKGSILNPNDFFNMVPKDMLN